jgi:hypothetical protein
LSRLARVVPGLRHQQRRLSEQSTALAALRQRVRDLLGRLKEHERLLSLVTEGSTELTDYARHHRAVTRRAALFARSDRPIIVGPWCGEVGFELLYWIPFVRWLTERAHVDGDRLVVVTRGGADVWYQELGNRGIEIFDIVGADAFRDHAPTWKQHRISTFDRALLAKIMDTTGVHRPRLLHPQLMYKLFTPYWKDDAVLEPIAAFLKYQPLSAPPFHAALHELPEDFVAAKFYFSQSFPDTAANRGFVQRTIASVAEQIPVVLLTAGAQLDDHEDAPFRLKAEGGRIHTIRTELRDNLAVQSAVVSRARAFIGTYGGFSYLAPMYGVNSLSFYSQRDKLVPFHLEHAQRVFGSGHGGRFIALDVADAGLLSMNLSASASQPVMQR